MNLSRDDASMQVWEGNNRKTVRARLLLLSNYIIAGRVQSKGISVYHAHHPSSRTYSQLSNIVYHTKRTILFVIYTPTLLSSLTVIPTGHGSWHHVSSKRVIDMDFLPTEEGI